MGKTNFDYLIETDNNLYQIMSDAERLYRGEVFEQCMGQTRRFGEHLCRNVLGSLRTNEVTFDEMLATLKDKSGGNDEEKEFIDDLYFLKKQGNISVHSGEVTKNGTMALECLQRAFEAGLNYAVYKKNANPELLKLQYDVELLVTGNPSKKTLSEKYTEAASELSSEPAEKEQEAEKSKAKPKSKPKKTKKAKSTPQVTSMHSVPLKSGISPFWIVVGIFMIITFFTVIYILI